MGSYLHYDYKGDAMKERLSGILGFFFFFFAGYLLISTSVNAAIDGNVWLEKTAYVLFIIGYFPIPIAAGFLSFYFGRLIMGLKP